MGGCRVEGQKVSAWFDVSYVPFSVHQGHLDGLQSAERGARWKCFYHLHVELGLAVQLVSPVQTADNGREPSDLAFTPTALAFSLSQGRSTGWVSCNNLIY